MTRIHHCRQHETSYFLAHQAAHLLTDDHSTQHDTPNTDVPS